MQRANALTAGALIVECFIHCAAAASRGPARRAARLGTRTCRRERTRLRSYTSLATLKTSPNSMGLRRLITEFLWPPSSSIIRPWLPYSIKVLVKTNQTSPNSMGLRRLITEFLWPPSGSIIRR
ncbi:hypothetical protein EVAR_102146_1 [Eumeta japonica]|uniref:Secreted protein n=1 Tax=Eumeta variegata TaxID=151549 RepID=A0A4C1U075_EUMVA|nr:hypothetical protein EVAR_102146_1 [Eumeta japonica]